MRGIDRRQRWAPAVMAMLVSLTVATAMASPLDHTRVKLGASTMLKYRLAIAMLPQSDPTRLRWYLDAHLDSAQVGTDFNPLNLGVELGLYLPWLERQTLGVSLERPLYTDTALLGVSTTFNTRPFRSPFNMFFGVQWLHYLEPPRFIGEAPNSNVFNFYTGFSLKLGGWR